jgi:elongation factor Ts
MAEITAAMVKELRDRTQVGMMEAKRALTEANGDMEAAIKALREKNAKMQVKEGRTSAEGLIAAAVAEGRGALIEINSETDFVARNEEFVALGRDLCEHAVAHPDAGGTEALLDCPLAGAAGTARDRFQEVFAKMRENLVFKRFTAYETSDGTIDAYIHMGGQIGVMVELSGQGPEIKELAREVAMHIAAARPKYLAVSEVPESALALEQEIIESRVKADEKNANKPAEIIAKIIEGGVKTFFKETVLLEQPYVREPKQTVTQLLGGKAEIRRFVRYEIGEAGA